jgi:hypothetical protein
MLVLMQFRVQTWERENKNWGTQAFRMSFVYVWQELASLVFVCCGYQRLCFPLESLFLSPLLSLDYQENFFRRVCVF